MSSPAPQVSRPRRVQRAGATPNPPGVATPGTPVPGSTPAAGPAPVPAAGARTWTLKLPAGMKLITLNDRLHWAERARRNRALQQAAWALARQQKIPLLDMISVVMEYQPPNRHRRDEDNLAPVAKACIDGLAIAGVVTEDTSWHVRYDGCRIGEVCPGGRVLIHISEVAA